MYNYWCSYLIFIAGKHTLILKIAETNDSYFSPELTWWTEVACCRVSRAIDRVVGACRASEEVLAITPSPSLTEVSRGSWAVRAHGAGVPGITGKAGGVASIGVITRWALWFPRIFKTKKRLSDNIKQSAHWLKNNKIKRTQMKCNLKCYDLVDFVFKNFHLVNSRLWNDFM